MPALACMCGHHIEVEFKLGNARMIGNKDKCGFVNGIYPTSYSFVHIHSASSFSAPRPPLPVEFF